MPSERLTEEQRGLAERYVGLARSVAARYRESHPSLGDEFFSATGEALCRAAMGYRFDPARPATFAAFARPRLTGACVDVIRSMGPRGYRRTESERPTDEPLAKDNEPVDPRSLDSPVGWEIEHDDFVHVLSRKLPPGQGEFVQALYAHADCLTIVAASTMFGIAERNGCRRHAKAIASLRPQLSRADYV